MSSCESPNTSPAAEGRPGRRWLIVVIAAFVLVLVWAFWRAADDPAASRAVSAEGGADGGGGAGVATRDGGGGAPGRLMGRRAGMAGSLPSLTPPAIPWQARVHTNGVVDYDQFQADPAYQRRVMQHDRLKTLLNSPARETPECEAIVAFADRKGLPLAAVVDLYNIVWATRQHEQRMAAEGADQPSVVRDLELSDFQRRFHRDFDVDVGPMLEELFALPLKPTVFMGVPGRGVRPGEPMLSD